MRKKETITRRNSTSISRAILCVIAASLLNTACFQSMERKQSATTPAPSATASGSSATTSAPPASTPTPAESTQWTINPGISVGAITAKSSLADLIRAYGKENVKEEEIFDNEGNSEPGVRLFPNDPLKTLEIKWGDAKLKRNPSSVSVNGDESLWQTSDGIKIGLTLREAEELNGKPFTLYGFGWDYGGTQESWENGKFAKYKDKLILRFRQGPQTIAERDSSQVQGDTAFSSANKAMQKINPRVYEIINRF
jgi:hypothetical protein